MTTRCLWTAAAVVVVCGADRALPGAELTLTRNGKPAAAIILDANPVKAAQFAAFELQWHVKAISGATLPIMRGRARVTKGHVKIHLGDGTRARELDLGQTALRFQEHAVRWGPGEVVLVGKDAVDRSEVKYNVDNLSDWQGNTNWPSMWEDHGTLDAVYDFLRDACGVRWLNPTDTGTVIPKAPTLTAKGADVRRMPTFSYRDILGGANNTFYDTRVSIWGRASTGTKGAGFKAWEAAAYADLHKRYPDKPSHAYTWAKRHTIALFLLRMRNGGQVCRCNHSLYGYYGRFWKKGKGKAAAKLFVAKRPELFAKGYGGDRPPQLCYTNRALVEQVAQDARDYYDGKTDQGIFWRPQLPNPFPVEPMDNSSFCKCAKCQKWLALGKDHGAVECYSRGIHSDYFFQFVNAVQKELAKTHPTCGLVTLAYMTHAYPPKTVKLDPRVIVQFCFATSSSPSGRKQYEHERRLARAWADEAKSSGRALHLWLYHGMYRYSADHGNYFCFPGFFAHTIGDQMKLLKQLGYRGMFHCGLPPELGTYLTFRLMDNAELDVDALMDEYFTGLYGAAAPAMKKLYLAIEAVYCDPKVLPDKPRVGGKEIAWGYRGTAKRMAAFGRLLAEAHRLAVTQREKRNVELFDLAVWKYMTTGRSQHETRQKAPMPSVRAPSVPDAGGDPAKVAWDKAAELDSTWSRCGGSEPAARKLAGRIAHDAKYLYVELVDPCVTKKLVASPQIACYDTWELFLANQRDLPYRQFLMGPTGMVAALLNGEVNWRMYVRHPKHGAHVVCDTSAPDRWVARIAIPLREAVPGGVKPGGTIYLNVIRVASPAVSGQGPYQISTWVPYTTVHDVDRLAEVTLAP